ncbi:flavin-dependent oxidoreductase (plasmid) [Rhodococcus antarcticus]|jgi:2-polyprenyl-6-methoxyphenol hydroxylase-like FAD-dependent oxidoreductase|uniref:Flavin-dependent oxidoreductase n=1 Tax=Rhodococcus antarcticus TaxID=2987751 RepID=A0ABY6P590_9NOCA|nr:flavin-dependent oxidoreductase [Rhodococcus antarcticus]UZJ26817.1 flavin-dependent oxidoreductase [Rhodococcus antarcticus]
MDNVVIIGAGIGGLTLALELHAVGIPCRVYEGVAEIAPVGVGINVLPHASRALTRLGLEAELSSVAVLTEESAFYNRFGQLIYRQPAGLAAGYEVPQYSIHRGDLQGVLLAAVLDRLGADSVVTGWRCTGATQDDESAVAHFIDPDGDALPPQRGRAVVGCDGIHSAIRKMLHPDEGAPRYSGVNMWRGVTVAEPFLTGASMVRAGWLTTGKLVVYPIRNNVDTQGRQLVNWVAEIETPQHHRRDWNRTGRLEDFIAAFDDWHFDWLDVPALMRSSEVVLEYPMVDQDPLDRWSFGRLTVLGDAAHPMVPRGSNGAGQSILDARILAQQLLDSPPHSTAEALTAYEHERLPVTAQIVTTNRTNPPDAILREVYERTGDQPFADINDVISHEEMRRIIGGYETLAGYAR